MPEVLSREWMAEHDIASVERAENSEHGLTFRMHTGDDLHASFAVWPEVLAKMRVPYDDQFVFEHLARCIENERARLGRAGTGG